MSAILVRYKFPPCSSPSFTSFWWQGCRCHTKINSAKIWLSFDSTIWIKLQPWTKHTCISPDSQVLGWAVTRTPSGWFQHKLLGAIPCLSFATSPAAAPAQHTSLPTANYSHMVQCNFFPLLPAQQDHLNLSFPSHKELLLYTSTNRKEAGG